MPADRGMKVMAGIVSAILVSVALYYAASVFAPLALALFIIAMVWPLQKELQSKLPKMLALAISLVATLAICLTFAYLVAWGFGRVGRSLMADVAKYQLMYDNVVAWLASHGISVTGIWTEHFNLGWLLRAAQQVSSRVNTTLAFWLIAFIYVMLGLLEVDVLRQKLTLFGENRAAQVVLKGSEATAVRIRQYMWVRTQMSILTGVLVWFLAWVTGLQFALEWGVIAFALNFIPIIGPFVATIFPTLLAMTQFGSWEAVLGIFVCLNVIQFVVGNYIEPLFTGSLLSISPTLVLFSVFFWTFLWGLFGTFIGVPITLAILAYCEQHPASAWIAKLFGKPDPMTAVA